MTDTPVLQRSAMTALQTDIHSMQNNMKTDDFHSLANAYNATLRSWEKAAAMSSAMSGEEVVDVQKMNAPDFLVKAVVDLEDYIQEKFANKSKMSKIKAQALNKLRAQVRKGNAQTFPEEQLEHCREHPEDYANISTTFEDDEESEDSDAQDDMESEESSSESESESDDEDSESSDSESESESESESSSSESEDESPKVHAKPKRRAVVDDVDSEGSLTSDESSESDSDESSSDESSSSYSSSSDSDFSSSESESESESDAESAWSMSADDESEDDELDEQAKRRKRALKWLKDSDESDSEDERKQANEVRARRLQARGARDEAAAKRQQAIDSEADEEDLESEFKIVDREEALAETLKTQYGIHDGMEEDDVVSKTKEILQQRGRKGVDRQLQLNKMLALLDISEKNDFDTSARATLLGAILSHYVDQRSGVFNSLPRQAWLQCFSYLGRLIAVIASDASTIILTGAMEKSEDETVRKQQRSATNSAVAGFIEQLDEDLYKSLQSAADLSSAQHSAGSSATTGAIASAEQYTERLADSYRLAALEFVALCQFKIDTSVDEGEAKDSVVSRVALKLMDHLYYRAENLNKLVINKIGENLKEGENLLSCNLANSLTETSSAEWDRLSQLEEGSSVALVGSLAACVYNFNGPMATSMKVVALLRQIFHYANNDRLKEARRLITVSNVHERVPPSLERALAAIGMAHFRAGNVAQAHKYLYELCGQNRCRELLAQGYSRVSTMRGEEKTPEQEKAERRRRLPYHMHMNLELVETAHMICGVLLEVTQMAYHRATGANSPLVNRVVRRSLELMDRQTFLGPPESGRDSVLFAGKAALSADVDRAVALIQSLKIWDQLPTGVLPLIEEGMRETCLQVALYRSMLTHTSVNSEQLSQHYKVKHSTVNGKLF
ncbi:Translation initiation factor 3 subunit c [Perkinsus olseni]|uniref:Translation initiation factor 3 subunit c n=1 Tax=Perkinsus olseni TaxID=32597 RepID=A0A7J6P0B7_PEROL|nr:Translation initiation factor 3 subunit c [Perkinsus olseni]